MPQILRAAKDAGAQTAGYVMLRLPWTVLPVFTDWLERTHPLQKQRGSRMRSQGVLADQIKSMFELFTKKYGLDGDLPELDCSQFRPPRSASGQLRMF